MKGLVSSWNEWDPLEDVVVGRIDNSYFPDWDRLLLNTIPEEALSDYQDIFASKGKPIPQELIERATSDLQTFIDILTREGINVWRPDGMDFGRGYSTPDWEVANGLSSANPRDVFLVVGDLIIECPMSDRGRYFEAFPFRTILKELFKGGARWISAPKPSLSDKLYYDLKGDTFPFSITEFEPTFDAADFLRFGNNIVGQLSHATNNFGVEWLQHILPEKVEISLIESLSKTTLHIDTTIMPLAEGKLLFNPEFVDPKRLPEFLQKWDLIEAPKPKSFFAQIGEYRVVSDWMSMNVLSLDGKRVVVEENQEDMIRVLRNHGFEPIPCPFESYYIFGGSFHCATLDLKRCAVK
ncbi:MAG TPA: hypothetical protein PKC65_01840 [Pyrinomonadaceae bacterium]|nr:hypothetical protein [Pyrinomonadaceae bacterium]